jgi:hypothetical protein
MFTFMTLAEGGSGQTFLPVLKEADLIDRLFLCLSFHHIQSAVSRYGAI